MNQPFINLGGLDITPWAIVGYIGALLFSSRWILQVIASKKAHKPVMPTAFWLMSIVGSLLLLAYFMFGVTDTVGILSNLFPFGIAVFNLLLDIKNRKTIKQL